MIFSFQTVGIVGCFKEFSICKVLYFWLKKRGHNIIVERKIADFLKFKKVKIGNLDFIGKNSDIIIAIGGDGNILRVGKRLARYAVKIIGINQGHLGFLTDITPRFAIQQLSKILSGKFYDEKRFLLDIKVFRKNICYNFDYAINEIVLNSGKLAHMMEFEVYINNVLSFFQRSDGLIISTPTGSTAYSLSVGGPIVSPSVDAIILAPIFPHSLSSRPLIVNSNSIIRIKILKFFVTIKVICDGNAHLKIRKGEEIIIQRSNYYLHLIHPINYNYFNVLTRKLGWLQKLF